MIVTLDFETYYDTEYSLSRISETDYILDPRWETIMCAVKLGAAPTQVHVGHDDIVRAFAAIQWDNVALLSHNMRFDGGIAAWRYGVQPKLYLDTLGMARSLTHAYAGGSSLAKVAKYLGLPAKGDSVVRAKGKYLRDFSKDELDEYSDYCAHDCELSYAIFQRFMKAFPKCELAVIDAGIRMFIAPQVRLDGAKLALHLSQVRADKAALMARVGHIDPSVFSSNNKFAALLQELGVDVPTKTSPATGQDTWALAKNDRAFKELCEDPDQPLLVQALLAARVGAKSTIEETRTATLLNLSQRSWSGGQGWMPVPLRYYAAHTGRFGGDGGFNFLNLRRGSPIRDAIVAPDGYRIVHRDSSQIEARMVSFLAGCQSLLDAFAEGRDIYSEFASRVYGRPVTKANVGDRFVGKTSILGLGYGMGAARFQHTLFIGNGGVSVRLALDEAAAIVRLYRDTYPEIALLWRQMDLLLHRMILGDGGEIGPVSARDEALWLPNGMAIQYKDLRQEDVVAAGDVKRELVYDGGPGRGRTRIYGPKAVENTCQALSRIVITDVITRVAHSTGYYPFLSTYDSIDLCIPESEAPAMDALLEAEFAVRPAWATGLPLASEGGWGISLMDAERRANQ